MLYNEFFVKKICCNITQLLKQAFLCYKTYPDQCYYFGFYHRFPLHLTYTLPCRLKKRTLCNIVTHFYAKNLKLCRFILIFTPIIPLQLVCYRYFRRIIYNNVIKRFIKYSWCNSRKTGLNNRCCKLVTNMSLTTKLSSLASLLLSLKRNDSSPQSPPERSSAMKPGDNSKTIFCANSKTLPPLSNCDSPLRGVLTILLSPFPPSLSVHAQSTKQIHVLTN